MNCKKNKIWLKLKAFGAILMVALLLAISFVQVFHSHPHGKACHEHHDNNMVTKADTCKICDFFIHKSGKEFLVSGPLNAPLLFAEQVTRTIIQNAGTFINPSGSFSNKGPPAA